MGFSYNATGVEIYKKGEVSEYFYIVLEGNVDEI
jgi:CRP-like cAMP-binding protein